MPRLGSPTHIKNLELQPHHLLVMCLQSCDVLALQPGASLTLPSDPAAAEAAVYSTPQQFYHLLAGLLEISESAWGASAYSRGYSGVASKGLVTGALLSAVVNAQAVQQLLPKPCAPPNAGVSLAEASVVSL